MSDLELCYLPATEALQRFKSKTLSPVELLDAMLQRIEETEPVINALTFKHFAVAATQATERLSGYCLSSSREASSSAFSSATISAHLAPPNLRGGATNLVFGAQSAMRMLIPLAGGFMADTWGVGSVFYLLMGIAILGALTAVILPNRQNL